MKNCGEICSIINRKKRLGLLDPLKTKLERCLSTFDLTFLGIGGMLGAGMYVLSGTVAKDTAGPAVVLSFILAGFASLLAAISYAELGALIPKAGSAYTYCYVTVGELWAFLIGWNVILEYMIGSASVAVAWSGTLDELIGDRIRNFTIERVMAGNPWDIPLLAEYPNFLAFFLIVALCILNSFGANISSKTNFVFAIFNLVVVVFVVVAGLTKADIDNWTSYGGFTPFGFKGVIQGAATCFFAYVGFDVIAISGEEAKTPGKSVPLAICISLGVATASYVGFSVVLTLMVPYFDINEAAAIPDAFAANGLVWAQYIVGVGSLAAMTTAMLTFVFAMPRIVYSMAMDGLIFAVLGQLHKTTKVPVLTVWVFGLLAALFALLFDLDSLVEFMSIGTLLAYTIVSACIIILRYTSVNEIDFSGLKKGSVSELEQEEEEEEDSEPSDTPPEYGSLKTRFASWPYTSFLTRFEPGRAVGMSTLSLGFFFLCFLTVATFATSNLAAGDWWAILLLVLFGLIIIALTLVICMHVRNDSFKTFKVPGVPFVPLLSMFINLYFMLNLSLLTWLRFFIWVAVGVLIYIFYGASHSKERTLKTEGELLLVSSYKEDEIEVGLSLPNGEPSTKLDEDYNTFKQQK